MCECIWTYVCVMGGPGCSLDLVDCGWPCKCWRAWGLHRGCMPQICHRQSARTPPPTDDPGPCYSQMADAPSACATRVWSPGRRRAQHDRIARTRTSCSCADWMQEEADNPTCHPFSAKWPRHSVPGCRLQPAVGQLRRTGGQQQSTANLQIYGGHLLL